MRTKASSPAFNLGGPGISRGVRKLVDLISGDDERRGDQNVVPELPVNCAVHRVADQLIGEGRLFEPCRNLFGGVKRGLGLALRHQFDPPSTFRVREYRPHERAGQTRLVRRVAIFDSV